MESQANKGEWSELFAVASIISAGRAFEADGHLRPISNRMLKVAKLFLNRPDTAPVSFSFQGDGTVTRKSGSSTEILSQYQYSSRLEALLADLKNDKNVGSFSSLAGVEIMTLLGIDNPSASSTETSADFEMILLDPMTDEATPRHSFSVKSQLGSPATLLNASRQTNITFGLCQQSALTEARVKELNEMTWLATRDALIEAGCDPIFRKLDGETLYRNVRLVDSAMPEVIANLVRSHYFDGVRRLDEAAAECYPGHLANSEQIIYKIKEFVGVLAMGMRPNSTWSGDPSAFKGMVVVTREADVVVFYVFNVLEFRDFLFHNLGFERGSATRHGWGQVYPEAGEWRIKLNLQLRFLS